MFLFKSSLVLSDSTQLARVNNTATTMYTSQRGFETRPTYIRRYVFAGFLQRPCIFLRSFGNSQHVKTIEARTFESQPVVRSARRHWITCHKQKMTDHNRSTLMNEDILHVLSVTCVLLLSYLCVYVCGLFNSCLFCLFAHLLFLFPEINIIF